MISQTCLGFWCAATRHAGKGDPSPIYRCFVSCRVVPSQWTHRDRDFAARVIDSDLGCSRFRAFPRNGFSERGKKIIAVSFKIFVSRVCQRVKILARIPVWWFARGAGVSMGSWEQGQRQTVGNRKSCWTICMQRDEWLSLKKVVGVGRHKQWLSDATQRCQWQYSNEVYPKEFHSNRKQENNKLGTPSDKW